MRSSMIALSLLICAMQLDAAHSKSGRNMPPLTKSSSTPNLTIWLTSDERSVRNDKPSERPKNEEKEESKSPIIVREPFPVVPRKADSMPLVMMGSDGKKLLHVRQQGGTWSTSSDCDQELISERVRRLSQEEVPDIRRQLKDLQQQVQATAQQTKEVHKEVTGNVSPRLEKASGKLDELCKSHVEEKGRYAAGVQNTQLTAGVVKKTREEIKSDLENIKTILEVIGKKMDGNTLAINKKFDELKMYVQAVEERLVDTQATCMLIMEYVKKSVQKMDAQEQQLAQVILLSQKIFEQGSQSQTNIQKIINCLKEALEQEAPTTTHETAKIDSSKKA